MKCKCGCGKETTTRNGREMTYISGHNGRGRRKQTITHECRNCLCKFETIPSIKTRSFCSSSCRNDYRKKQTGEKSPSYKRQKHTCEICKKDFMVTASRIGRGHGVYCSMECGREGRRRKISGKSRQRRHPTGKTAAKRRDSFTCLVCGFDSVVAAHHIIPKRYGGTNGIANIITLCPNHHYMAHAGLLKQEYLLSLVPPMADVSNILAPVLPSRGKSVISFRDNP